jgi:UDP:flavonoid glycosyltransferase YjiC (YdhE family)
MVPTVYMPIYAEQSYNTKLALRLGFATAVNKLTITERELDAAIQMVKIKSPNFVNSISIFFWGK